QGLDRKQIVRLGQFARGMTPEASQSVFGNHALAIIGDANQPSSAFFDLDGNARGSGVERVLEHLFDDRRWTLYNLTGGNSIGDVVRENIDFAPWTTHAGCPAQALSIAVRRLATVIHS